MRETANPFEAETVMKILFIYPNAGSQLGFNYGVAHLSALLRQNGHDVLLWQLCEDLEPLPDRETFIERMREAAPDLVAFSVVTNQWGYAKRLAAWTKEASDAPRVIGGIHATVACPEILDTGLFESVFRGESEDAFLEYVEKRAAGKDLAEIPNRAFMEGGHARVNPVRPLPDLRALPFKDYSLFDFQKLIDAKNGWVGIMASRGCPFSCTYCFNHRMVSDYRRDLGVSFRELNYIRRFDVEQVMEEIRFLTRNYENIRMFIFDDDLFTFDLGWLERFCRAYRDEFRIPFVVNAHVGFFDRESALLLKEAGCRIVKFGVESGSPEIRTNVLNRRMTNDKIVEAIRTVEETGMHSSVFLIIGFPRETPDDIMQTVKLVAEARPGRFRWTFFFPYPGTEAYRMSVEGGYVNFDRMAGLKNFTDASCLDFGGEQNLLVRKIGRAMPWFVNAYSSLPVAGFYRDRVSEILAMDSDTWERESPAVHERDREYSRRFIAENKSHYAVKYNPFMGVISDYFTRET